MLHRSIRLMRGTLKTPTSHALCGVYGPESDGRSEPGPGVDPHWLGSHLPNAISADAPGLHPGDVARMVEWWPRQDFRPPCRDPTLGPTRLGVLVSGSRLSVAVPPPMLAPCSASMRRRPRPSVGCSMKAANCPPRSSSAGTSPGSRIMPPPGVASGRSQVGSRCLPCPGSEPGQVGSNHRRPDGLRHSCRCGADESIGGMDRDAGSARLSGRDDRAPGDRRPHGLRLARSPLAEVQAQLPPGLERTEREPSDPPEVVEVWFPRVANGIFGPE